LVMLELVTLILLEQETNPNISIKAAAYRKFFMIIVFG
jgi:hypothetical protein